MASKQSGYPDSQNRDFLSKALHESIQKVQKWKDSCSSFSNPSDHEDFPATQPVSPLPRYAREPEEVESATIFTNPSPNSVSPVPSLLHLSFNQDNSCFVAGTSNGIRIYSCDPFRETIRREFTGESGVGGSIGVVEMLFQSNLFALVGAGKTTEYGPNKLMIWDDHQTKYIGELWFRSEVKAVRLRRDRIIVVLENKIFVYDIRDMKLLDQIDTVANPKGLCVVSQALGPLVLVCLGLLKGQVRVEHHGLKRTKFINAHESRIACFAITQDGHLLATASGKGTLVRIFNTLDGSLVREVRRGAVQAEIYSLAFSSSAQWLAVSSDTGTVHVFNLEVNSKSMGNDHSQSLSDQNLASSNGSSLSFLRGVLPKYFSSEWSVAQFHLNEGSHHMVGFGHEKNTLVILGMDGSFYRCKFDPHAGGEMTQLEYYSLLKPEETF